MFDGPDATPEPTAFVAVVAHVYVFPFVNPATTIGLAGPVAEPAAPPFDDVHETEYAKIGDPPSFAGAENATLAPPGAAVATRPLGVPGVVAGTKPFDAADGTLGPTAFVAVAVHVYDFPFVNPATTIGLAGPVAEPAAPPFDDVHETEYAEIGDPPSFAGAENATRAPPGAAVATRPLGAPGVVAGTKPFDAADGTLGPTALDAVAVHVYDFPFVNPATTIGLAGPVAEPAAPPFDDDARNGIRKDRRPAIVRGRGERDTCCRPEPRSRQDRSAHPASSLGPSRVRMRSTRWTVGSFRHCWSRSPCTYRSCRS